MFTGHRIEKGTLQSFLRFGVAGVPSDAMITSFCANN